MNIKLATLAAHGSPWDLRLREMGQNWRDQSNGAVKLTIYPGGVAGDESAVIRKMRIGQLNAATLSTGGLSYIVPEFTAVSHIPMLYNSDEEKDYVREKMSPELIQKSAFPCSSRPFKPRVDSSFRRAYDNVTD